MRVSGGELRSREIPSPRGVAVRPTPGRVREALFSILGERIAGARVLDLYAGTGAIGFEALSRGAAHVTFVERHAGTAQTIRATARTFAVDARATVICAAAEMATRRIEGRIDVVYADPPYALPPPHASFENLRARETIDTETTVVYEHRSDAPGFVSPFFPTTRENVYGEVTLQFMHVLPRSVRP